MARPMIDAPAGLRLTRPLEEASDRRVEARRFCLDVIKDFYGYDYRRDWHADLDGLVADDADCWFSATNRGAFWALRDDHDGIVATAALYTLDRKPALARAFADRYLNAAAIPQLARVYVAADRRGQGIGGWLADLAEAEAVRLGFHTLYLHASADTSATLAFWRNHGFVEFANADGTAHFDKSLVTSPM